VKLGKKLFTSPGGSHIIREMKGLADTIIICPMTEDDLDAVLSIERASFPRPWTREHFLQELESPTSFPLSAFTPDGSLAGYICPMLVLDEGQILDVAVRPDLRGTGLGRLLVGKSLLEFRERSAEYVGLEVRVSNRPAIALYSALGFRETGLRKNYYHDGEDAIVMEYIFEDTKHG
jgi:ribosomal-protein-alanine N-acetyltransferase